MAKPGRNDRCPCGSGKKYKACCLTADEAAEREQLAKAQAALEHDMAFYQLSDEDVAALYDKILAEAQAQGQAIPSFEALEMEVSPEAQEAAQFIITLLTGK